MKPASATMSAPWRSMRSASASSKASRLAKARWSTTSVAMPRSRANARPAASARLLTTAAMRASQRSSAQARTIASMLEPRPEMRMTMFFIGARSVSARPGSIPTMSAFAGLPSMSDQSPAPSDPAPSVSEGEAVTSRRRVLSGMRPTGAMHLGHWHGALKNWVRLQDQYECFFFAADWHALTTHYEEREVIESSVYDMVTDWLAAGLDPDKVTLFIQSRLPEHAELFTLLAMGTPLGWLERMPTYKDQMERLKDRDLATYGFLGYPLLQAADILIYKAAYVPVGVDQAPHVEITREVARRFNHLYGREPDFDELVKRSAQEARQGAREGIRGGAPGVPRGRRRGGARARPRDHRGERVARRQRPRAPRRPPARHRQDDPGRARRAAHRDLEAGRPRRHEDEQELRQRDRDARGAGRGDAQDPPHADRPGARAPHRSGRSREVPGVAAAQGLLERGDQGLGRRRLHHARRSAASTASSR